MTNVKVPEMQPDSVAQNDVTTAETLRALESSLPSSPADQWLFDLPQPTALDAHLVVLIARLRDIKRLDLVSERLLAYAANAWEGKEFQGVMQGRKTIIGD